jgi:hypothetical protein
MRGWSRAPGLPTGTFRTNYWHISPAHSENVNFFGVINVEAEPAKLDSGG